MARDFKILEEDYVSWLFMDPFHHSPDKSICYRHVIQHALFHLLKDNNYSTENCSQTFISLKKHFDDKKDYIEDKNFLTLYRLAKGNDEWLLIDRTRWCYPLVFDNSGRIQGLIHSLVNIENKFSDIINCFNNYPEWSNELQKELNNFDDRN